MSTRNLLHPYLGAVISALLLSAAIGPASVAGASVRCSGPGRTVFATPQVQLRYAGSGIVYACRAGSRRPRGLFTTDVPLSRDPGRVALAGRFVVFTTGRCRSFDHDTGTFGACSGNVKVYDARRDTLETTALAATAEGTIPPLDGLVVTADGWVAWIVPSAADETLRQVWVRAPHATAVKVAESAAVDPGSLAVAAHTLYWTDGLQPRSLPLR